MRGAGVSLPPFYPLTPYPRIARSSHVRAGKRRDACCRLHSAGPDAHQVVRSRSDRTVGSRYRHSLSFPPSLPSSLSLFSLSISHLFFLSRFLFALLWRILLLLFFYVSLSFSHAYVYPPVHTYIHVYSRIRILHSSSDAAAAAECGCKETQSA